MRKILLIAFYFGETDDIGARRLTGLAEFLPQYGWEPVILAPRVTRKSNCARRVVEVPYQDLLVKWKGALRLDAGKTLKMQLELPESKERICIDRIMNIWEELIAYPDAMKDWRQLAVQSGIRLLQSESFDAILSSSYPPTSHLIAKDLKEKSGVPWIADLRDLWTQNHNYHYSPFRRLIEERLERRTLSSADVLITVSEPMSEKLANRYKSKNVHSIPNGFNPSEINPGIPLRKEFNITYTGNIYRGRQNPEPLFIALRELQIEKKIDIADIRINFFGTVAEWLQQYIEKYNLQQTARMFGRIPRDEALLRQRESQLLLLLTWNDSKEEGLYTGKIFEYLAAHRPILSIGESGGVVRDLLEKTKAGIHTNMIPDIKDYIIRSYQEHKTNQGVKFMGIEAEIEKFSQLEMTKKFTIILDEIAGN